MRKKALFVGMFASVIAGFSAASGGCSANLDGSVEGGIGTNGFDSGSKIDAGDSGNVCLGPNGSFGNGGASTQTLAACSQTEITTLDSMINSTAGTTYVALYGMVGASCQKCLFSNANDATWQAFVWVPDMQTVLADLDAGTGNSTVFDNSVAACIAHVPAGGAACSAATTANDECYQSSCESCISQSDFDTCLDAPDTAAQCTPLDTRSTACTTRDQYDQALQQCGFDLTNKTIDFKTLFNVTCGNGMISPEGGTSEAGSSEGGTDAGPG